MKISTEIVSASRITGERQAVEYVAKAGFNAWDFSMFDMCKYNWGTKSLEHTYHPLAGNDYLKFARELKQIGLDNGIECNQSHAPFPTSCKELCSYYKRAIECTAEAGGKICVIHPDNVNTPEQNAEFYLSLLPFAKECGVKIATENMYNWNSEKNEAMPAACSSPENFKAHIDTVNDEYLVACVDIGHAEMKGLNTSAAKMIRYLGKSVQALHIHDNDKRHDSHEIPFSMNIDFDAVLKALKVINYTGYFTLEADSFLKNGRYNANNVLDGLKKLADAARKLSQKYELL